MVSVVSGFEGGDGGEGMLSKQMHGKRDARLVRMLTLTTIDTNLYILPKKIRGTRSKRLLRRRGTISTKAW